MEPLDRLYPLNKGNSGKKVPPSLHPGFLCCVSESWEAANEWPTLCFVRNSSKWHKSLWWSQGAWEVEGITISSSQIADSLEKVKCRKAAIAQSLRAEGSVHLENREPSLSSEPVCPPLYLLKHGPADSWGPDLLGKDIGWIREVQYSQFLCAHGKEEQKLKPALENGIDQTFLNSYPNNHKTDVPGGLW